MRFKQIIANLLSNAIKFTREGQVTVVLGVWPQARGARVELSVEDTGQGIAQTDLARLGAPYRQAAGGRGSRVGAGLGLSICRSLAALMQGRLELHSVLGCGTRVQVQFDAVPGAAAPRQTARETSRSRLPALQVLVVDDYPANRVLLERQLTFLGHRVTVAEHGAAGLRAWLRGAYDVVISDCNMPGINGYQLVKAVREHERRKHLEPCLFLGCTANAQIRERLRCLQQGMDDCLFKPLSLESLALHLDPHRARRQAETQEHEVDLGSLDQLTGGDAISLQRLLDDLADSNLQDLKRLQSLTQTLCDRRSGGAGAPDQGRRPHRSRQTPAGGMRSTGTGLHGESFRRAHAPWGRRPGERHGQSRRIPDTARKDPARRRNFPRCIGKLPASRLWHGVEHRHQEPGA